MINPLIPRVKIQFEHQLNGLFVFQNLINLDRMIPAQLRAL